MWDQCQKILLIVVLNIQEIKIFHLSTASRRQIDAESLGGGYVNEWTTETFSKYVKKKVMEK